MTKTEIYQQSVLARLKLLQKIVATRKEYAEESVIIGMLASQGSFAKYEVEGIVAMSLNSLKKHANDLLEGGYPYLDLLRKKALFGLQKHLEREKNKAKPSTKKDLMQKLSSLKTEKVQILEELQVASMCIKQLLLQQGQLVNQLDCKKARARFQKERHEILSLFTHGVQSEVALAHFQNVTLFKNVR